jgi:hypothetical protein
VKRFALPVLAAGLFGYPICILAYWWLTPAYGLLDAPAILKATVGHSAPLIIGNALAFAACVFAIAATLAYVAAIGDRSPRLAVIGGAMSMVGWVAVFGTLVLDVVAVQMVAPGAPSKDVTDLFSRIAGSPTIIALNSLAAFHLVGGILLGVAFWRTRMVPRWAAVILIIGGPIHFASNIAGILSIDSATWIALVAANVPVFRRLRDIAGSPPHP